MVSIGFPQSVLKNLNSKFEIIAQTDKKITINSHPIVLNEFIQWKESTKTKEASKSIIKENTTNILTNIEESIKLFPLESKTPLECMQFISELKQMVRQSHLLQ